MTLNVTVDVINNRSKENTFVGLCRRGGRMYRYIGLLMLVVCMGCSKGTLPKDTFQDEEAVPMTTVTIESMNTKPEKLLKGMNTTYVKGLNEGEYIVVTVSGALKDIKLVSLSWDDEDGLQQGEVIQEIGALQDEILIVESYHVEGIPSEQLVWTTENGEEGSYTFVENGKEGFETRIFEY